MGYGSGVFKQPGYDPNHKPMVDLIFAVTNPTKWHATNLEQNPHHYSFMRHFSPNSIAYVQERTGAGIYYNTNIPIQNVRIKYGVIAVDTLIHDLIHWDTLYMAGRLNKPIKVIQEDGRVRLALQSNLKSALLTALLLLPAEFSDLELFLKISRMSYTKDIRMLVGLENPHKATNIVLGQIQEFRNLYYPILENMDSIKFLDNQKFQQDLDPNGRARMLNNLPTNLQNRIAFNIGHQLTDKQKLIEFAAREDMSMVIQSSINNIVFWPTISQSLKGIITAGPAESLRYLTHKYRKRLHATKPIL